MKNFITYMMIVLCMLAMLIGMNACSTVKRTLHKEIVYADSASTSDKKHTVITSRSVQADTVVYTDTATLEGAFDMLGDSVQSIESEALLVNAYIDRQKHKLSVRATAKPKAVRLKINRQLTVTEQHTERSAQTTHKTVQIKDAAKTKSRMAAGWWVLTGCCLVFFLVLLIRYLLKKYSFNIFP